LVLKRPKPKMMLQEEKTRSGMGQLSGRPHRHQSVSSPATYVSSWRNNQRSRRRWGTRPRSQRCPRDLRRCGENCPQRKEPTGTTLPRKTSRDTWSRKLPTPDHGRCRGNEPRRILLPPKGRCLPFCTFLRTREDK